MKLAQEIILRPVITENSMEGVADKKYTFKVAKDATKIDVKRAVEELFDVIIFSLLFFIFIFINKSLM